MNKLLLINSIKYIYLTIDDILNYISEKLINENICYKVE